MAPFLAAGVASLGAFAIEFVFYINPYRFHGMPDYTKRVSYWVMVFIGAIIAAGIAFASASDAELKWYAALNIGCSWPVILQQTGRHAPEPRARSVN